MKSVGVVGAGTMGAGIAALAAQASLDTLLYDPDPEALARAPEGAEPVRDLRRSPTAAWSSRPRRRTSSSSASCSARLAEVVEPGCVLATNTSSLSVTAIAAGVPRPERVVGMHFFNPPARMRLVEVVAGEASAPRGAQRSPARRARRWAST